MICSFQIDVSKIINLKCITDVLQPAAVSKMFFHTLLLNVLTKRNKNVSKAGKSSFDFYEIKKSDA